MKRAFFTAGLVFLAYGAAAQDIRGDWRTAPDDNCNTGLAWGVICDESYCGTLV